MNFEISVNFIINSFCNHPLRWGFIRIWFAIPWFYVELLTKRKYNIFYITRQRENQN